MIIVRGLGKPSIWKTIRQFEALLEEADVYETSDDIPVKNLQVKVLPEFLSQPLPLPEDLPLPVLVGHSLARGLDVAQRLASDVVRSEQGIFAQIVFKLLH